VTLVGATNGAIPGSLIVDPANMSVTFNATANYLAIIGAHAFAALPDDMATAIVAFFVRGFHKPFGGLW
jgi:hypothetical protein